MGWSLDGAMIKIMVDGEEHSRYDETEWVWINVGSGEDAEVRLPWAAKKHLSIYFCSYGGFTVEIHHPEGRTHKQKQRYRDPDGWRVFVRESIYQ